MSSSLQKLGYYFNNEGILLNKEGKKFVFTTQEEYEKLGEAITEEIYYKLENEYSFKKIYFDETEESSFIYGSQNYERCKELIIFINGSGVVRAGQWARSIIINESLSLGAQFEYFQRLYKEGRGMIVFNTNDNISKNGNIKKNSSNAKEHALFAFNKFVLPFNFARIGIIAHSYGGTVTEELIRRYEKFNKNIKCIVLTDASFNCEKVSKIKNIPPIINYIISNEPLGKIIKKNSFITYASAGTEKHERSSGICIEEAVNFINSHLNSDDE